MIKVGGKKGWFEIEFLVIIQPVIAPRLEKDLSSILGQVDFLGGKIIGPYDERIMAAKTLIKKWILFFNFHHDYSNWLILSNVEACKESSVR